METVLSSISDTLAAAVESAGSGVVRIEARRRFHASGVVWSADGLIVTNHHVVQRSENIRVGMADGSIAIATLVGRDPTTDIAVLQVEASNLSPLPQVDIDRVRVGTLALALGRPGSNVRATLGIISARSDNWRTPAGGGIEHFVQSDATLFPGFSGGPLVNTDGQMIGLTSSGLLRGVSVVIPNVTLGRVVASLSAHGRIRRGYLGVTTYPVRLPQNIAESLGQEEGLLLLSVEPESPSDRSGLMVGDLITSINGHSVEDRESLQEALGIEHIGATVPAQIIRGGEVITVDIQIGERNMRR